MKKINKIGIIPLLLVLAFLTFSCEEEIKPLNTAINDVDLSTMGVLKGNPILSDLVKAIERTEISSILESEDPYTLFAPTNAAFNAFLKTTSYKTIDEVPKDVLQQILLNHVLKDAILAKNFTNGYTKTLAKASSSENGYLDMYINRSSGIVLNGVAKVITGGEDLTSTNGIIHIVDNVIFLPTVVTHAQANPDFKSLVDNLVKTVDPNLVTALSGTGPFTVFAPTNAAFTAFNTELAPGGLSAVTIPNLTKVLQYHVTNGNLLAANLSEGQVISTLETPQTFEIQLTGGPKIKDVRNRITNITATDVQCNNGVIHVVDRVLRPNL